MTFRAFSLFARCPAFDFLVLRITFSLASVGGRTLDAAYPCTGISGSVHPAGRRAHATFSCDIARSVSRVRCLEPLRDHERERLIEPHQREASQVEVSAGLRLAIEAITPIHCW